MDIGIYLHVCMERSVVYYRNLFIYIYIHTQTHTQLHSQRVLGVQVYAITRAYTRVCVRIYIIHPIRIYTHTIAHGSRYLWCVYVCVYVCAYVSQYMRSHVHTHVCTCVYISYIHIFIYTHHCIRLNISGMSQCMRPHVHSNRTPPEEVLLVNFLKSQLYSQFTW